MEKWHLLWISLLTSTYLLAWNIQMKEIQIKNEKTNDIVEGKLFSYFLFANQLFLTS